MAKFIIMHVIKHCFTCSLRWWLYMAFHSNILLLLMDTSPEIEIPWHIIMYIYQKSTNFFNDLTMNLNDQGKGINSSKLQGLALVCNSCLLPTVMCPKLDSLFLHNCRYTYIDIIIQCYLQHYETKITNNNNLKELKWSRNKYLIDDGDEY